MILEFRKRYWNSWDNPGVWKTISEFRTDPGNIFRIWKLNLGTDFGICEYVILESSAND